jgi:hypothetical protein
VFVFSVGNHVFFVGVVWGYFFLFFFFFFCLFCLLISPANDINDIIICVLPPSPPHTHGKHTYTPCMLATGHGGDRVEWGKANGRPSPW